MTIAPAARATTSLPLVGTSTAVGCARLFVAYTVRRWGYPELVGNGETVVAELVERAVATTGIPKPCPKWNERVQLAVLCVRITLSEASMVIEVRDGHDQAPELSGRVRASCRRWHYYLTGNGRVTWCELGLPYKLTARGLPRRRAVATASPVRLQPGVDTGLLARVRVGLARI